MAKPYRLSPLAEADLEEIWLYTVQHWSMGQADVYYQNLLVAAFEGLAIGMRQGRPSALPAVQKSPCGAHVDYFIDDAEHLDVVRILHQ